MSRKLESAATVQNQTQPIQCGTQAPYLASLPPNTLSILSVLLLKSTLSLVIFSMKPSLELEAFLLCAPLMLHLYLACNNLSHILSHLLLCYVYILSPLPDHVLLIFEPQMASTVSDTKVVNT